MNASNRRPAAWLALLFAALAVYAGLSWRNRDVNRISRRLEKLRAAVAKTSGETPLAALARAREVSLHFTDDADIQPGRPLPGLAGREEVAAAAHQLRSYFSEVRVELRDKVIRIEPDRRRAAAEVTAEGFFTAQGETEREIRSYRMDWVKRNDDWLVHRVAPMEVIRRPPDRRSGR